MMIKLIPNFLVDKGLIPRSSFELSMKDNIGVSKQIQSLYPSNIRHDFPVSFYQTRSFANKFVKDLNFKFKKPSSLGIDANEITTVLTQNNFTGGIKPAKIFGYEIIAGIQQLNTGFNIKCFFTASHADFLPDASSDVKYNKAVTNVLDLLTEFEYYLSKIPNQCFLQHVIIDKTQGYATCNSVLPHKDFVSSEQAFANLENLNIQWIEYLKIIRKFNQPLKKFIIAVKDNYPNEYLNKKKNGNEINELLEFIYYPSEYLIKKKKNSDEMNEFLRNELLEFISNAEKINNKLIAIKKIAGFNNKEFVAQQVTSYDLETAMNFQKNQKLSSYYVQQNFVVKKPEGYFNNSVKDLFHSYYDVSIYYRPPKLTWLSYISHYNVIPKNTLFYPELTQFLQSFF